MNCLYLFALTVSLLIPIHTVGAQDEALSIRVMSYNIRYNNPGDGINAWPNRKDHVAEMMGTRHHADIAGLQEALKGQIDDLAERLKEYSWLGVGREDGKEKGEYSPIFYRKDRFKLVGHNTFWLSETPSIAGSKSWDSALMRIVTWGKFLDRRTGKYFYHFNTHFDHRGDQARIESAKLLWQKVQSITGNIPTVVTGDFNVNETSVPYAVLTGKEAANTGRSDLKDARYLSKTGHQGPTATFVRNEWTTLGPPESKIDFIFVRNGFSVLSHRVLDDQFNGRFPSDHLPVLAEIRFP